MGSHSYTRQDAQRTLSSVEALWMHHRHASALEPAWIAHAQQFFDTVSSVLAQPLDESADLLTSGDSDGAFGSLTAQLSRAFDDLDRDRIASLLAAIWDFFPRLRRHDHRHHGRIGHLHASKGLPKKSIERADIGWRGVEGDIQRKRAHHGRPWQALCLWSVDALDTLRAEGHPIAPGYAGENITVAGIPAAAFRPGARFRVGAVEGFLSSYSIPCSQNSGWFADGDFDRMHFERGDQSRVYAMVTAVGTISIGDAFEMISDR